METKSRNKKIISIAIGIVLLFAAGLFLKNSPSFTGASTRVILEGVGKENKVFVDNERAHISVRDNQTTVSIQPGVRDILVSRDGYWPWLKQVTVTENQTLMLNPFLFPQETVREEITGSDPEYEKLLVLTTIQNIPDAPGKLLSTDLTVTVWKEKGALNAQWLSSTTPPSFFCADTCEPKITFLGIAEAVRELSFWRNRADVVIISMGADVYALELDRKNVQNFQPIYHGKNPSFAIMPDGELYIQDNKRLYHISAD